MKPRAGLMASLFLFFGNAFGQLPKADTDLLTQVSERAAYVESLSEFCNAQEPAGQAAHEQALRSWKERNYWTIFESKLNGQPKFPPAYLAMRERFGRNLNSDVSKYKSLCSYFDKLLRYRDFDPSASRSADLQRLAGVLEKSTAGGQGQSQPSGSGGWPKTPPGLPSVPEPNSPVQSTPAAVVPGQNFTVGAVSFSAPPGWRLTQNNGQTVTFEKTGKYKGKSLMLVTQAGAASDVAQALGAYLRTQFPAIDLKHLVPATTVTGTPAAHISDYTELKGANRSVQVVAVGLLTNGNLLVAQWISTADSTDKYDHRGEFEAVVKNWKLNAAGKETWSPLTPPAGSGGLEGVFMGSYLMNQINPLGGLDLNAIRKYLVLRKNGQAFRDLPEGGQVFEADFAAACRKKPVNCGTYQVRGDSIGFRWFGDFGLVEDETRPFSRAKDGVAMVDLGMAKARQVQAVHNLRLSGKYTSTFAMVGNMAMSSTSVVSQTFIEFGTDGSYHKSGFGAASFTNENASGTTMGRRGVQTGRYSIDGFTLILMPTGGSNSERFTILLEDANQSPKALFIDDKAFLRDGS